MPKFGITKETKSKNLIPFNPPIKDKDGTWKFPVGKLVSVIAKEQTKKDESTSDVLQFVFVSPDNKQTYMHTEWEVDEEDSNKDKKQEGMNTRIKHIFECFAPFPEKGIGTSAKNWAGFFEEVAKAFNAEVEVEVDGKKEKKKLIDTTLVWIKLTYYKNRLQFPLSPNFVERATKGVKTDLRVNLEYDTIEQIPAPKGDTFGGGSNPMVFDEEVERDFPEFE